jgi:hypothetical protein
MTIASPVVVGVSAFTYACRRGARAVRVAAVLFLSSRAAPSRCTPSGTAVHARCRQHGAARFAADSAKGSIFCNLSRLRRARRRAAVPP